MMGLNRQLVVQFDEGVIETFSGWIFNLSEQWESGGSIELTETRAQLQAILDNYAETNPDAVLDPEGILTK